MAGDEDPIVYVVRLSTRAANQVETEHQRQEKRFGFAAADRWEDAVMDAIASLATYPKRCPAARENGLFQRVHPGQTLRQLIYQQTRGSAIWRILFTIHDADENDPPTVQVHQLRYGTEAPITFWPTEDE